MIQFNFLNKCMWKSANVMNRLGLKLVENNLALPQLNHPLYDIKNKDYSPQLKNNFVNSCNTIIGNVQFGKGNSVFFKN